MTVFRSISALTAALAACCAAFAFAGEERRVALVIGNAAYQNAAALQNPVRDAAAIAGKLRALGFEVHDGYNLDRAGFAALTTKFGAALPGAAAAAFYFAGHGLQANDENHLLPVDADLKQPGALDFATVRLRAVLKMMERDAAVSLAFIDACRDNPMTQSLAQDGASRSINASRGLAPMSAGAGALIMFATDAGKTAADGVGKHSPFTAALLRHITTPQLDVALMLREVRRDVMLSTNNRQLPWSRSSLTEPFYFHPASAHPATAQAPVATAATVAKGFKRLDLARKPGQWFRDCAECPEMTALPPGRFLMSASDGDTRRRVRERKIRRIHLKHKFAISRFVILEADWEKCSKAGVCRQLDLPAAGKNHAMKPARNLSRIDAQSYIRWLNEKTSAGYRLPSEAEWQFALGAPKKRPAGFQNAVAQRDGANLQPVAQPVVLPRQSALYGRPAQKDGHNIGRFGDRLASFRLWQWLADCHQKNKPLPPSDGAARASATNEPCPRYVLRRRASSNFSQYLRSAERQAVAPETRSPLMGFRVARDIARP